MAKGITKIHLVYDDCALLVAPSFIELERNLVIEVKKMVENPDRPWERQTKKVREKMYTIINKNNSKVLQTYSGFLVRVLELLCTLGHKYTFQIYDRRQDFPEPQLKLMKGFRFSQEDLLTKALIQNRSGLIGAPTRWGKFTLVTNTLRAFPDCTSIVTMPGVDLIKQAYNSLCKALPERDIKMMGSNSKTKYQGDDITVCSIDSLHKCNDRKTKLLLIDEPHAAVTEGRLPLINNFTYARKYGFGATLTGRFDNRDELLTGVIGPVLVNRTFREGVDEGAICNIACILFNIPPPNQFYSDRNRAYKQCLFENPKIAGILQYFSNELVPKDWQTLMFIKNEKQAEFLLPYLGEGGVIAMAKRMNNTEREDMMDNMASGEITRCLASDIYAQGVTFSNLRCLANAAGGGPYTNTVQKPGRLAEVIPGKKCGIMFDVMFKPTDNYANKYNMLATDSKNRYEVYKEKGYDIYFVDSIAEMKTTFESLM